MNKLKATYVSVFLTVLTLITGYAIYDFRANPIAWGGVLLTTLPLLLMLTRAFLFSNLARTSEKLPVFTGLGVVGIVVAGYGGMKESMPIPVIVAVVAFIGFQLYNRWYSNLDRTESVLLKEGQQLPEFTVYRTDGREFSSSEFNGSPALILFYRGNWCPLCMAQIREIAAQYKEMADKGIKIALVSPQPESHSKKLSDKFDVPFLFLVDKNNAAAEKLNIAMKDGLPLGMEVLGYDGDTVLPTALFIDAEGKIVYSDQTSNYRVRPEPEEYLRVAEANGL
ncbi:hypothetical protein A9Q81_14125 [Gammaproteobacteria bacterium 42_54_T18]|nr:hypothetical protein A9Q81_14125 [Gammaproteobacteria bacterium 42_54_T18]